MQDGKGLNSKWQKARDPTAQQRRVLKNIMRKTVRDKMRDFRRGRGMVEMGYDPSKMEKKIQKFTSKVPRLYGTYARRSILFPLKRVVRRAAKQEEEKKKQRDEEAVQRVLEHNQ